MVSGGCGRAPPCVAGVIVAGSSYESTLILTAHNHQFSVAHFVNFSNRNDELLPLAGMVILTLWTGLGILLNRGSAPFPARSAGYSVLVAAVGAADPLSFAALLFGLPTWPETNGVMIAVKQTRGSLDPAPDGVGSTNTTTAQPFPVEA